ncbi:MAG: site-2 protease family protein [Clostridiales bacterium]|nr:site-2 protease family protein [Clostridiales bacterium]
MFRNFDFLSILYNIPAVLICITVHEFSHGYVAYHFGDPTAKQAGRLSLNPLRHIDIMGFICLILFRFGWAKPVPVSYGYLRNPKKEMALIAAAGPISNVILSFVFILLSAVILTFAPASAAVNMICNFLFITAIISTGLAVFNLIPIPPLDGSKIITPLLSGKAQAFLINNGQVIQIILIVLLLFGYLSTPIGILRNFVLKGVIYIVIFVLRLFGIDASYLFGIA